MLQRCYFARDLGLGLMFHALRPLVSRLLPRPPLLSVVVVAHRMQRELPRTLATLSASYQLGVSGAVYEVIVVDNGSDPALDPALLQHCEGVRTHWLRIPPGDVSPCRAVNQGAALAQGSFVAVMVDGARMLSPGVVVNMLRARRLYPNAFIATLGWHLGPEPQNISMLKGYNQAVEDELLQSVDWRRDGYRLFEHSALALSCSEGWFSRINESNCFALPRRLFHELGGFEQRFRSPGGGLVNLDFFREALESNRFTPVLLLGEGSFHQFHGGIATNVPLQEHPWEKFHAEYRRIRGRDYAAPDFNPQYLGGLTGPARRFLAKGL